MDNYESLNRIERLRETKGWKGAIAGLRQIESILVLSTVLIVFNGVVLRYVFKNSMLWAEEILVIISLWMYYIGAVIGTEEESHIKGDLISGIFKKPKSIKWYQMTITFYSVVITGIFAVWVTQYSIWQTKLNMTTQYLHMPKITSQYAIGFGMLGMLFYFSYHLIRYVSMKPGKFASKENYEEDKTVIDEIRKGNEESGGED